MQKQSGRRSALFIAVIVLAAVVLSLLSYKIEITRAEIEMIIRNSKRLERLSSDILELSKIGSGAIKLNKELFSLSYVVADSIKDAKARSIYDPQKLKISYIPDDIFVRADKEKIAQVVSNLLTNAIKFTSESGGSIEIITKAETSSNMVTVTMIDTGQGIDLQVIPRLFEKFVIKSEKGTGIGLYILKNIIEAHGGKIWGKNNEESRGSNFWLHTTNRIKH